MVINFFKVFNCEFSLYEENCYIVENLINILKKMWIVRKENS